MKRVWFAVTVVVGLAAVHPSAQTRPNFSGTWSAPLGSTSLRDRLVISHDGTSLLVERPDRIPYLLTTLQPDGTPRQSWSAREPERELYRLDGSELKRTFTLAPLPLDVQISRDVEESVSSASWQDQAVVIVSRQVIRRVGRPGEAVRVLQTARETLRLAADGTLVIERRYTLDPPPASMTQPIVQTSTYRKDS